MELITMDWRATSPTCEVGAWNALALVCFGFGGCRVS